MALEVCLEPPRVILGPSWGHLGAILGPSWGHFGAILGPLGAILSWGHRPRALDVLRVMARRSIQLDTITCNVDVSAWETGGECLSQHCYGYVEPTWLQIC